MIKIIFYFQVTRMLPGGMWVLGVFIVGPEDILDNSNNVQRLILILDAIHKTLSWNNKHLYGHNLDEKLILNFNSVTQKYVVFLTLTFAGDFFIISQLAQ